MAQLASTFEDFLIGQLSFFYGRKAGSQRSYGMPFSLRAQTWHFRSGKLSSFLEEEVQVRLKSYIKHADVATFDCEKLQIGTQLE